MAAARVVCRRRTVAPRGGRRTVAARTGVWAERLESRTFLTANPPVPLGPEFPLTSEGSDPSRPAVAADGAGCYYAAWDAVGLPGTGRNIYLATFDADGQPVGPSFRANAYVTADQTRPAIAASDAGVVLVWVSSIQDGDGPGVFGQAYDAGGDRIGFEFQVAEASAGQQSDPSVAAAPDGSFVVTWTDSTVDGLGSGIAGRRFGPAGNPVGGTFRVNTVTAGSQMGSAVGMAADGRFVVAWEGPADDGTYGVSARRFAADGTPLGDEFPVTPETTPDVRTPAVAVAPGGDFVVAWHSDGGGVPGASAGDGSGAGVFARRFGPDGLPLGAVIPVNAHTAGRQISPAVVTYRDGSFVAAWESGGGHDGDGSGVYARRFGADGAAAPNDLPVNNDTAGDQFGAVAAVGAGGLIVAWRSAASGGADEVRARLFALESPPDDPPVVSVSGGDAAEADAGSNTGAVFNLRLSGARPYPVSVRFSTADGTAVAHDDYLRASGVVTFAPGETSKSVTITVIGDVLDEAQETFSLTLSDPVNATLAANSAVARITDNDPLPLMSVSDAAGGEVNAGGAAAAVFNVVLSVPSGRTVRANYQVVRGAGDTATAWVDFDATSGVVTFAPGVTGASITVPVLEDSLYEGTETFSVVLSLDEAPTFALGDAEAVGTIGDDDAPPTLAAGVVSVSEGDDPAGRSVDVPLTLSAAAGVAVMLRYATADDSAAAPGDYEAAEGSVTFQPGETAKTIRVRVVGDDAAEPLEAFWIRFTDVRNATAQDARVTVVDDDADELPVVTGVFVSGAAWTPAFLAHLAAGGAGSGPFGFLVGGGAGGLDELPWANLDRVTIRFNREVTARQGSLVVRGAGGDYAPTAVAYDRNFHAYTWTFARPFRADRLVVRLDATSPEGVADALTGLRLDGEWAGGADDYPSGNGLPGGDFTGGINVLPGDATRDGNVDGSDLLTVRARQRTSVSRRGTGPHAYSIFGDLNGTGSIDALDYAQVRSRQGTNLPPPPSAALPGSVRVADRASPPRRGLFGTAPILG